MSSLLAEHVLNANKDESRGAAEVAGLYEERWKNRLKRFKQLVRNLIYVRDVLVEYPGTCSGGAENATVLPPNRVMLGIIPVLTLFCVM